MLELLHNLLMAIYVVLPPLAIIVTWVANRKTRRGRSRAARQIVLGAFASILLGLAGATLYSVWAGQIFSSSQVLLTCYWAAGLLCLLRLLDGLFDRFGRLVLLFTRGWWMDVDRHFAAQIVRVFLLFVVGLPYMITAAVTYRPRSDAADDNVWHDLGAKSVQFSTSDCVDISGLWLTADPRALDSMGHSQWGAQTVILCREGRFDDPAYFTLARGLMADGYNILTFDFRAQGGSGGSLVSFGALESRDVLGAIHWVRLTRPNQARRIVGIGVGTGGAALLGAAADPSPDGQALAALALYGGYDRFTSLADVAGSDYFVPPLRWLVPRVGIALASVQIGADLTHYSPAANALAFAPRPVLFIHARQDWFVRAGLSQKLYEYSSAPKSFLSFDGSQAQALNDPTVAAATTRFLDNAVPML